MTMTSRANGPRGRASRTLGTSSSGSAPLVGIPAGVVLALVPEPEFTVLVPLALASALDPSAEKSKSF